ncbi:MAG: FlgD immunoglobulin-like domain containing protein, partial [Synechococcaceae cyanobacterium]|nr:FlgD immunoglobulin-like domain containing protein [Synechococcaceae cyanobacterium]
APGARDDAPYLATRGHRIAFGIRRRAPVTISLFDVTGRLVATPVDEVRAAGDHETLWDGRAGNGRPAAAGVYFVRLATPGFTASSRIVRIR